MILFEFQTTTAVLKATRARHTRFIKGNFQPCIVELNYFNPRPFSRR